MGDNKQELKDSNMNKFLKDIKDVPMISTSRLHCQYATFIEVHKDFQIPYHPYMESVNTFEDMVIECLPLIIPKCPKDMFDKIVSEVVRHPYSESSIRALLAIPICFMDGKYHEDIAKVVRMVVRFCICNGYTIYFNKYLVRNTALDDLTDSTLKASVSFYQFN